VEINLEDEMPELVPESDVDDVDLEHLYHDDGDQNSDDSIDSGDSIKRGTDFRDQIERQADFISF
jgi:hypothetical protein